MYDSIKKLYILSTYNKPYTVLNVYNIQNVHKVWKRQLDYN